MAPQPKTDKLRKFIEQANESLTRAEFSEAFATVKRLIQVAITDLTTRIDARLAQIRDGHTPTNQELLALIRPLIPKVKDGETPTDQRLRSLIVPLIPTVKDGEDGKDADEEAIKSKIEGDLPQLGEAIRDALELLNGTNRLNITAIDGIEEALQKHATAAFGSLGPGGGTSFAILQDGEQKVQQPLVLDFKGSGAPVITSEQNGRTSLTFTGQNGSPTTDDFTGQTGTTFVLSDTPIAGTIKGYRGGGRQREGNGNDYTIVDKTVTLSTALSAGETLLFDYNH
jgi:hypothetical protein